MSSHSPPCRGVRRVFRGRFSHTVDPKGRLSIPAKFRETLEREFDKTLVVATWQRCLWALPTLEWTRVEESIAQQSGHDPYIQKFQRIFLAGGQECPVDDHGRIALSAEHRQYAGIEKDVLVMGLQRRIEIWAAERWRPYEGSVTPEEEAAIGRHLADLGIK